MSCYHSGKGAREKVFVHDEDCDVIFCACPAWCFVWICLVCAGQVGIPVWRCRLKRRRLEAKEAFGLSMISIANALGFDTIYPVHRIEQSVEQEPREIDQRYAELLGLGPKDLWLDREIAGKALLCPKPR